MATLVRSSSLLRRWKSKAPPVALNGRQPSSSRITRSVRVGLSASCPAFPLAFSWSSVLTRSTVEKKRGVGRPTTKQVPPCAVAGSAMVGAARTVRGCGDVVAGGSLASPSEQCRVTSRAWLMAVAGEVRRGARLAAGCPAGSNRKTSRARPAETPQDSDAIRCIGARGCRGQGGYPRGGASPAIAAGPVPR